MDAFRNQRTPFVAPKAPKGSGGPKPPRVTVRVKPMDPNAQAQQNAMSAFRTALAQLQASTPAVDANAIYAPYRSSEAVTGQLGTGLQQSLLNSGQAAQTQYTNALGQAQQQAAQFGISAGAGANATQLQNNGAAPLAQQTNAYAAAAPQAATAWQQALERAAGAKVADATLQRQNLIATGSANLSTALPGAIQNEKTLAFQKATQRDNMNLARTQLTAKQQSDLRSYGLGVAKAQSSAQTAADSAQIRRAALAERTATDKAKLAQGAQKIAQGDQALAIRRRASTATAKGLKGVSTAVKALSGSSSTGTKPVTGYKVTYVADGNGVNAGGPPVTMFVKDPASAAPPAGYLPNKTGQPVYGQAGKSSQGITAKQWDTQMRALLAQNPGQSAAVKALLGPRPKK